MTGDCVNCATLVSLAGQVEALTKERDEARREICEMPRTTIKHAYDYAHQRGWDCYKEAK